jgi:hypothetical protein
MANIGVSELLLDPDFVDTVTVLRQVEIIGDDGIAVRQPLSINILASIQSNDDALTMTPDLARTEGAYEIITTFPLLTATDTNSADIVLWNGKQHRVTSIGRFGNFATGFGHFEGIMEIISIQPVPLDALAPAFSGEPT